MESRLVGVPAGESVGDCSVHILSKFSTLLTPWVLGRKGDGTSRFCSFSQLMQLKKGCFMTSWLPFVPLPSLLSTSLVSRPLRSDWALRLKKAAAALSNYVRLRWTGRHDHAAKSRTAHICACTPDTQRSCCIVLSSCSRFTGETWSN